MYFFKMEPAQFDVFSSLTHTVKISKQTMSTTKQSLCDFSVSQSSSLSVKLNAMLNTLKCNFVRYGRCSY